MTLTISGATLTQAKVAVGWFTDLVNNDARNWKRNGDCLTLRLTRFVEGFGFAASVGLTKEFVEASKAVQQVARSTDAKRRYDEAGGSLYDENNSVTLRLADYESDTMLAVVESLMLETVVQQWVALEGERTVETALINAFFEGRRGLAVGSTDLTALVAGEGILSRYSDAA